MYDSDDCLVERQRSCSKIKILYFIFQNFNKKHIFFSMCNALNLGYNVQSILEIPSFTLLNVLMAISTFNSGKCAVGVRPKRKQHPCAQGNNESNSKCRPTALCPCVLTKPLLTLPPQVWRRAVIAKPLISASRTTPYSPPAASGVQETATPETSAAPSCTFYLNKWKIYSHSSRTQLGVLSLLLPCQQHFITMHKLSPAVIHLWPVMAITHRMCIPPGKP